ncbi:MAG: tetratricopeptide repeat protein, partial [Deltaproteobacteria bacterium]|nr:tetratricopeptide repeat protein [Deltaproteobacteria bacterium]
YKSNGEEDPFAEFRKERQERITESFDKGLFNKTYDKFFLILSGWNNKTEGYYTKDEIFFMNGLFIMDELVDYIYFTKENVGRKTCMTKINDGKSEPDMQYDETAGIIEAFGASEGNKDEIENKIFQKITNPDVENGDRNLYRYVYGDEIKEKIFRFYEKALRYFNRAINYNPNNPRYYYEYARCLKNSGKSDEAEIFFKKAFDLNG